MDDIDGKSVDGGSDVRSIITDHKAGDKVAIKVQRGGDEQTLTVELGKRSDIDRD